jgi:hypothetical protein
MSKSKTVKAEIVRLGPEMEARGKSDTVSLQTLAAQLAQVIAGKQDDAIFEPFFRTRQVSYELRRLQNVAEQDVLRVVRVSELRERWQRACQLRLLLSVLRAGGNRLRAIVKKRMEGDGR